MTKRSAILKSLSLILALYLGFSQMACTNQAYKFSSSVWKSQYESGQRENPRLKMITELELTILRRGMSKQKVRDILGPPEQSLENSDIYELGVSAYGIDYEYYVIEYDQASKVSEFFLSRS